ncbi:hook-length control protein FliK [Acetitomaculum ruminis DSM 5522]|uniref:Hook-length control protein FliK n=1 Tax=Acetitomaculum ruminis DSM 5522 TaxID=1120918 RepID=A0A1I0ZHF2_9FIRM|nr:flagellar hook-length control protein FliK [Acetitomaculum ruminis]SFB25075.1 hook-length control protein FliK [Acetitomaculum ruminis DSM 5522]
MDNATKIGLLVGLNSIQNQTFEQSLKADKAVMDFSNYLGNPSDKGSLIEQSDTGQKKAFNPAKDVGKDMLYEKDCSKAKDSIKKKDVLNKPDISTIADKITAVEDKVETLVSEALGISKEELKEVMEEAGLSCISLLLPQNLTKLCMEVTNAADVGELLINSDFSALMSLISDISQEFVIETAIPKELLSSLIEDIENMPVKVENQVLAPEEDKKLVDLSENAQIAVNEENEALQTVFPKAEILTDESQKPAGEEIKAEIPNEPVENAKEEFSSENLKELSVEKPEEAVENEAIFVEVAKDDSKSITVETLNPVKKEEVVSDENTDQAEIQDESVKEVDLKVGNIKEEGESKGESFENEEFTKDHDYASPGKTVKKEVISPEENVTHQTTTTFDSANQTIVVETVTDSGVVYTSVTVTDILEQIANQVKINVNDISQGITMQLNPEHLGKLGVSLTVKAGALTASFVVENAQVKSALDYSIYQLRQSLEASGIKVDAVEVTIASHEFESNLEQGQNQNQNQNGQESSKYANGSLDEDGSGMYEVSEETEERIMRENGTTMNLTA